MRHLEGQGRANSVAVFAAVTRVQHSIHVPLKRKHGEDGGSSRLGPASTSISSESAREHSLSPLPHGDAPMDGMEEWDHDASDATDAHLNSSSVTPAGDAVMHANHNQLADLRRDLHYLDLNLSDSESNVDGVLECLQDDTDSE